MRHACRSLFSVVLVTTVVALNQDARAEGSAPKLAVMPLAAKRVPKKTAEILDELLINAVHRLNRYDVVGTSDISAMLGLERMKDALGCDNVSCAVELSGALGVHYLLAGSVGRLGNEIIVSLTLIDAERQRVSARIQQRVENNENLYAKAVEAAVNELLGRPSAVRAATPAEEREDKPWRKYAVSQQQWEQYEAYRHAAREASFEPIEPQRWKEEAANNHADWLAYFEYRGSALDAGLRPLEFKVWYTDVKLGRLVVRTTPAGAQVSMGGEAVGKTPVSVKGLPAGKYRVRVSLQGYIPQDRVVEVQDGREAPLDIVLLEPSRLVVRSTPAGADVVVNGVAAGKTPATLKDAQVGWYRVKVSLDGYAAQEKVVKIEDESGARLDVILEPNAARSKAATKPEWIARREFIAAYVGLGTTFGEGFGASIEGGISEVTGFAGAGYRFPMPTDPGWSEPGLGWSSGVRVMLGSRLVKGWASVSYGTVRGWVGQTTTGSRVTGTLYGVTIMAGSRFFFGVGTKAPTEPRHMFFHAGLGVALPTSTDPPASFQWQAPLLAGDLGIGFEFMGR